MLGKRYNLTQVFSCLSLYRWQSRSACLLGSLCVCVSVLVSVSPPVSACICLDLPIYNPYLMPVCLFVCPSVRLPACLSVFLSTVCLSVGRSVCLPACLPARLSVCLSVCLSIFLSVCLSVFLNDFQHICLSICIAMVCLCHHLPIYSFLLTELLTEVDLPFTHAHDCSVKLLITGLCTYSRLFNQLFLICTSKVFDKSLRHPSSYSGSDMGVWSSCCQQ